ncbi:MAG TPA: fibronectin type III domain-containing protein [Bryobacteraceae bacterium]|nr:fibronectin type III domain-containing protein [Bryobacteraceae bacterium]
MSYNMKNLFPFVGSRGPCLFTVLSLLASLSYSNVRAQAPPVPAEFQATYSSLNTYLVNFNTTLNAQPLSNLPLLSTAALANADANAGPQLVNPGTMAGLQLQLNELKAMGVQAVMVEVGFPMLYAPFLTSQGQTQAQFVSFYQQVAQLIRAAGLKVIVENDTLLANSDVSAGWDASPFYATLSWSQYQQARAQTALTIAQTMQPDYLVVVEEPNTEADNSGQSQADTPAGSASLLSQILASLEQAGVPGMQVGAGTGASQANAVSFIQQYVAQAVDFIDFHIYPVNLNFLPVALNIASTAAAAGKPVAMTECWLWKLADSEVGVLTADQARARNPFSFWAPLDAYFIQTMQNLAQHTQMLFMDPFITAYYAAYLPYNSSMDNLTPGAILSQENAQENLNQQNAVYTSTAMSYYTSLVSPPDKTPPSIPTGLAGGSASTTTTAINWNASTDNVGVAGYYVSRNGSLVGTTANIFYLDSGLAESTTYTYTIEAFDLGGNVSAPTLPLSVTTEDKTPPSTPTNLTASASSCQIVNLSWSASTDGVGIGGYFVFWGPSPATLTQLVRTPASMTTYTSYPLNCGTKYYYGVEAIDTSGNTSAMSTVISITTPNPPSPPKGLAATATSGTQVGLTWKAAASGELPVNYYYVYRGTSPTGLSQIVIDPQTSYTDTSVSPSTTYYYALEAADSGGDLSVMSAVVSVTTARPPAAPTNVVVAATSNSKLNLTWSAGVSGGLPINYYHVFRGTTPANLTQVAINSQTSYWDVTVTAGATYYYGAESADSGGDLSPMSAILKVTIPSAPAAVTNLTATPVSTSKISLTWSAAASGGLPIQSYTVLRGATAASLSQMATTGQTTYTDPSGSPSTRYYYAVQATDTAGDVSPVSATMAATTLALPSAPTNVAATAPSKSQVALTWAAAPSGMPLASYTVFRGTTASNLTSLKTVSASQLYVNDTTVSSGNKYYYAVQAKDTGGALSPMSAAVAVTTP